MEFLLFSSFLLFFCAAAACCSVGLSKNKRKKKVKKYCSVCAKQPRRDVCGCGGALVFTHHKKDNFPHLRAPTHLKRLSGRPCNSREILNGIVKDCFMKEPKQYVRETMWLSVDFCKNR